MIAPTNIVKDLIKASAEALVPLYDPGEAEAIIRLLFAGRFELGRVRIAMNPSLRLSESQIVQVYKDLKQLKAGVPVQYVLGYTEFMGMRINVSPAVLIPRPETEELVLLVLQLINKNHNINILDIGTGSGAIALALKKMVPDAQVYGLDISEEALQMATQNSDLNQLPVEWVQHDLFIDQWPVKHPLHCIVSNPPYIPDAERARLHINVTQYEPKSALFVDDDDPLVYYRKIGDLAMSHLGAEGILAVETHHRFAEDVADLFVKQGFKMVKTHHDLHGKQRMVSAVH